MKVQGLVPSVNKQPFVEDFGLNIVKEKNESDFSQIHDVTNEKVKFHNLNPTDKQWFIILDKRMPCVCVG